MWQLIILLCVSLVSSAEGFRYGFGDPKIYTFAFTQIEPGSFFNGSHLVGPHVELMKEICCRASKRCDAAMVDFKRCYNEDNLSEVLNGRWYDVCVDVSDTPRRRASYSFSDIDLFDLPDPGIIVAPGSKITLDDLRNPRNDIKVAFLANPELAVNDVIERFKKEFFVKPENIIKFDMGSANKNVDEIIRLINDPCSGVEVGVVGLHLIRPGDPFKQIGSLKSDLGDSTLMVRKDDQHILEWWDYTLKRFMCSPEYAEFCERMDREFGKNPRNCADPSQVDCSDCTLPRRVPACGCV